MATLTATSFTQTYQVLEKGKNFWSTSTKPNHVFQQSTTIRSKSTNTYSLCSQQFSKIKPCHNTIKNQRGRRFFELTATNNRYQSFYLFWFVLSKQRGNPTTENIVSLEHWHKLEVYVFSDVTRLHITLPYRTTFSHSQVDF